jgi:hypothetical protein
MQKLYAVRGFFCWHRTGPLLTVNDHYQSQERANTPGLQEG